jgi:hypothetical protein
MQAKQILKEHIVKSPSLSDEQFDFSLFRHQSYKEIEPLFANPIKRALNLY